MLWSENDCWSKKETAERMSGKELTEWMKRIYEMKLMF